jgi:hypothetical protein
MVGERLSVANHGLTEEDTVDRDMQRNLVWVKETRCTVQKSLDELMNKVMERTKLAEVVPSDGLFWICRVLLKAGNLSTT